MREPSREARKPNEINGCDPCEAWMAHFPMCAQARVRAHVCVQVQALGCLTCLTYLTRQC